MKSQRVQFCEFLKSLANGKLHGDDWDSYAVNHYADNELELARVELVRTSHELGEWAEVPDALRAVALEILGRLQHAGG